MLLIPAHAKVNLSLAVRGRRADGFHDIDSVVTSIDWHDLVGITLHPAAATVVRLRVAADLDGTPRDESNLASRAARALAASLGPLDIDLWLAKRIPIAAGLGGGSSDAAAVLRGGASLLGRAALDERALLHLAASLGSDVPVLLAGGTQRVRGRGERLEALSAPPLHLVVAVAASSSTADSYRAVEPVEFEDGARPDAVSEALRSGRRPADELLGSGLEAAACRANPGLRTALVALRAAVPEVRWHLTGSGGAAFSVADSAAHASALAARAANSGFRARSCRSVSG